MFVSRFLLMLLCLLQFQSAVAAENADDLMRDGIRLYQQEKFADALKLFRAANALNMADVSTHYYLGLAALGAKDDKQAKASLCRVVAMSKKDNQLSQRAASLVERYFKVNPYSCLLYNDLYTHGTLIRWSSDSMPLKIFVSHGLQLPDQYFLHPMTGSEIREIASLVRSRNGISNMSSSPGYSPEHREHVIAGLKQWDWAVGEGLLSYTLTDKPETADVVVFWCPTLTSGGAMTNFPAAANEPAIVQIGVDSLLNFPPASRPEQLKALAAHEFGHVFGLQHNDRGDSIMYPLDEVETKTRINSVTENDKATLRALYTMWPGRPPFPGVWFYSVSKRK